MNSSEHKEHLRTQITDALGKMIYTYTAHLKAVDTLLAKNNRLKIWQIILSAVTTGGILSTLLLNEMLLNFLTTLVSACSLGLNIYLKNFELDKLAKEHHITANELWLIREKFTSLLTDMDSMTEEEIINTRDLLQEALYNIYKTAPKTSQKNYGEAQVALQEEEEQYFSGEELNQLLPDHLKVHDKDNSD